MGTEFLCLYINDLNLSVINICRPPGTNSESFGEAIKRIDNWLDKIQKEFSDSRNITLGDFNLKDMKDWNDNIISKLKATEMNRNNRDLTLSKEKEQSLILVDFFEKWELKQ